MSKHFIFDKLSDKENRSKTALQVSKLHAEIFSQTLFDFKKSISGPVELKFSGKTLN